MNSIRNDNALNNTSDSGNWYNDFAEKLISGNFLLTALEFHAELVESGKELPKLKDFFSNPGNFENLANNKPEVTYSTGLPRSSSQATLDSLDLTRYSEDGERSNDDRVAVLEFELRKARETIVALRANLTVAAETEREKSEEKSRDVDDLHKSIKSSIKPHEQRALNFLINEYLLLNGYKLTSITFSDENESQDFDDWDDVGLNVGRPMELLTLYREGLKASGYINSILTSNFECQVTMDDDIQKNLKAKINELEAEVANLTSKISTMKLEFSKRLNSLEVHIGENIELESHVSLSPDPEYFEIIENVKFREESETRSDRSNGDWTKIGDRFKREGSDLRPDNQMNDECVNDKNQSSIFENITVESEDINENRKNEVYEVTSKLPNLDNIKLSDNFQEAIVDAVEDELVLGDSDDKKYDRSLPRKKDPSSLIRLFDNGRDLPNKFKSEFLVNCDMIVPMYNSEQVLTEWFFQTDPNCLTVNHIIDILSEGIPRIVPNIILNKREEIAPLLVLSICLNQSSSMRDKLLNLLYNLKKKPQEDERRMILSAFSVVAYVMGPATVENEVLPQCWEQITHKYIERRMLVAESCFILAPYVSEAIRNSLVISITKQLLQDREESVRKSAVNILALLVILTSDEEKFPQILDISLQVLNDESSSVLDSAKNVLYPALAQWSFTLKRLQSDLFNQLLRKLEKDKSLRVVSIIEALLPFLVMAIAGSECLMKDLSKNVPPPGKRTEFYKICKGLCDPVLFYEGSVEEVMGTFDNYSSNAEFGTSDWPELEWIWNVFIPSILETGTVALEDNEFLLALTSCFRYLCLGLGKNVTNNKIKPYLMKKIQECESSVVAGEKCLYAVIPMYLAGLLSINAEDKQELDVTLRKFICVLPSCGVSLMPLQVTAELLSRYQGWQTLVLDGIWEGVAHQRALVRSASAKLFQSVIHNIPENLISTKVLPALITLSSDPEVSVRTSSIPTLGMLVKFKDKIIKDKVYMTLQGILQENDSLNNTNMVLQFTKTLGEIYEDCDQNFSEEVILPQLYSIAGHIYQTRSTELIEVVTEVFATVSFSQNQLTNHCISSVLLPALRCLESICAQMNLPFRDRIDSMMKEVERRVAASKYTVSKTVGLPSPSEQKRIISNPMSTQVVVEDMKNRVTKIFHSKPNTLPNVSGIFKKKS